MTQSPTPSLEKFVNMPDLLDRVDGDRDLLHELFQMFKEHFPQLHVELEDAITRKDLQRAAKTAHMLKGMLANLSVERAAAAVEALDDMASVKDQAEQRAR